MTELRQMNKVFLTTAKRTPIGSFGGGLASLSPGELGARCATSIVSKLKERGSVLPEEVIVGNVLGAGHGMNIARQICLHSDLPETTPAYCVNKVCGSGLKSVALGAQAIALGESRSILAGGVESMSQAGFMTLGSRWGGRLGHMELEDLILKDGLTDVFHKYHMGITAENLAEKFEISREEQDAFALESQRKAKLAIESGAFEAEIVPVEISKRGKVVATVSQDEHPRPDATMESLKKLRPAFKPDGTVTAGNASGINDGAAFVHLVSEENVHDTTNLPYAEIVGWASGGVFPEVMGLGPVEATNRLLKSTGIKLGDIDIFESNEAFASQALSVQRELKFDPAKVNLAGGAIALGHPIGASGARILVTLFHSLQRESKELGLATLCVGGGQGVSILLRMHA